jgi:hypothetical protein
MGERGGYIINCKRLLLSSQIHNKPNNYKITIKKLSGHEIQKDLNELNPRNK